MDAKKLSGLQAEAESESDDASPWKPWRRHRGELLRIFRSCAALEAEHRRAMEMTRKALNNWYELEATLSDHPDNDEEDGAAAAAAAAPSEQDTPPVAAELAHATTTKTVPELDEDPSQTANQTPAASLANDDGGAP